MTETLLNEIARLALPAGGIVGVSAEHLESGCRLAVRGNDLFPMASLFKVAVACRVLERVDAGELSLDQMVNVGSTARVGPGGLAATFRFEGLALSVHNLFELMLTESDNSATDVLMEISGGAAAATRWLRSAGIANQRVDRTTRELTTDFFGIAPSMTLQQALEEFPELEERGISPLPSYDDDVRDTSTPDAMVHLFKQIFQGAVLPAAQRDVLLGSLSRCATGNTRLRGCLPQGTPVAHKTGTIGGTVNDAGIITLPDGTHLAIAIFIKKSNAPFEKREAAIAQITRTLFDDFLLRR